MKKITISKKNVGTRIDKFLTREFFSYTRGEIIRSIKAGKVLVNGKVVKPSYALKNNDELEAEIRKNNLKLIPNKNVKFEVIYKDKNIIAINKPAGIQVHPSTNSGQVLAANTLANGLLAKFPEIKNINDGSFGSELRPGIVHRLDKDTSGVMVVAKNQAAFDELKKLFMDKKMEKTYLAIVFGKLKNKKGLIEYSITRSKNYKKQTIPNPKTKTKIRPAATKYEVLKENSGYSLVKVQPLTGRTHQIRVHMLRLGHPIVGDDKYKLKKMSLPNSVRRQLLHAKRLNFFLGGKAYILEAPVPQDFSQFLRILDEKQIRS